LFEHPNFPRVTLGQTISPKHGIFGGAAFSTSRMVKQVNVVNFKSEQV